MTAALGIMTMPRPASMLVGLTILMGSLPNQSGVFVEREPTSEERRFLAALPAWFAAHPSVWCAMPVSDEADSRIRIGTVADETAGVQELARAARAADIPHQIDAYLSSAPTPYLTIPRG